MLWATQLQRKTIGSVATGWATTVAGAVINSRAQDDLGLLHLHCVHDVLDMHVHERAQCSTTSENAHSRCHDVAIWNPVGLLLIGAFSCELVHGTKIERNVAQLSLTTRTISRNTVITRSTRVQ